MSIDMSTNTGRTYMSAAPPWGHRHIDMSTYPRSDTPDGTRCEWAAPDCGGKRPSPRSASSDLRHTHATLLLADGVDALTVSRRLGHDSVQTTLELYGHVTSKMREGAAARFGALLS
jgi:integrase